jgi:hypothetical protein
VNRTVGGLPLIYWIGALGLGIGAFVWMKKKGASSSSPATAKAGAPASFTQAQEVQDFQVFSALTSSQQASDLNFLSEVAGLFAGGSSTGTSSGGGTSTGTTGGGGTTTTTAPAAPPSVTPAPPSTGQAPPATTPASNPGVTYLEPGGPVNFSSAPPAGFGYSFQNGQWGLTAGSGVGYVAA